MKNSFKLALVALVASATIISCDPPKPATEKNEGDTLKTLPDTTHKDTVAIKPDTVKTDTVKK